MGFISQFKSFFDAQQSLKPGNKTQDRVTVMTNTPLFNLNYSNQEVILRNEDVYSVVTRLSNALASLPIHLYKNYQQVDDESIASLLRDEPNPNQSGFEVINQTEVSRNTWGNGYILIERDSDTFTPKMLVPLNPAQIIIKQNKDDGSIWYEYNDGYHSWFINSNDVIHVKHITPVNSFIGISPIQVLRGTLTFEQKMEQFSLQEMNKKAAYIINYDRSMSREKREALLKDFYKMVNSNGGAILAEQGFDIKRYESTFKPADLKMVESLTRTRIANAFNVPVSFLNENSSKDTVNVEHVMTQFVINTLLPIVKQYEAEFNRKLLTRQQRKQGYYFKMNVNGLMRGDTAARTQFYQMMIRSGVATQNELRRLEDMPPIKDQSADLLWISKDLFPAENQRIASELSLVNEQSEQQKGGDSQNDGNTTKESEADHEASEVSRNQARGRYSRRS